MTKQERLARRTLTLFGLGLLAVGLFGSSPRQALEELALIVVSPCGLITDYLAFAGWGGAFLNAGLVTLSAIGLAVWFRAPFKGALVAGIFISGGFALFGKNLWNIWPIYLGVWLYASYQKEPVAPLVPLAFFGTALGPLVSELLFLIPDGNMATRFGLSLLGGMAIGFFLTPISGHAYTFHRGFNLYNMGFAAGLLGAVAVSLMRSFGHTPTAMFYWAEGYNRPLGLLLFLWFGGLVLVGWRLDPHPLQHLLFLNRHSGYRADFVDQAGFPAVMVNMGLLGLLGTGYLLLIGGQLNGPTVGTLLAVAGFGGAGLNLRNCSFVAGGVVLGSLVKVWNLTDPAVQLSVLLSTGLAPLAGRYGLGAGLLAGFLHSSVVLNVGSIYSALNLYNNGFSTGLVAALLAPLELRLGHPREDPAPPPKQDDV